MDRVEELQGLRAALREAISSSVKERGLGIKDTLDAMGKTDITH